MSHYNPNAEPDTDAHQCYALWRVYLRGERKLISTHEDKGAALQARDALANKWGNGAMYQIEPVAGHTPKSKIPYNTAIHRK